MPHRTFEHTLLHTLADNVPHRIYAKDIAGRFTFANRAVAIGMGASGPEELLGKTDFDFYELDAAKQYFEEERHILNGQPMLDHEEHVFYSRSGKEAWLLTTKVPLRERRGASSAWSASTTRSPSARLPKRRCAQRSCWPSRRRAPRPSSSRR
jgi:PAS domain S-box-containing protein